MGDERGAERRGGGRGGRRGSKLEGQEEIAVMDEAHEVLSERRRVCNVSGCNEETAVKRTDEPRRPFPADFLMLPPVAEAKQPRAKANATEPVSPRSV